MWRGSRLFLIVFAIVVLQTSIAARGIVLADGEPLGGFGNGINNFFFPKRSHRFGDKSQLIHLEVMGLAAFKQKILPAEVMSTRPSGLGWMLVLCVKGGCSSA